MVFHHGASHASACDRVDGRRWSCEPHTNMGLDDTHLPVEYLYQRKKEGNV